MEIFDFNQSILLLTSFVQLKNLLQRLYNFKI